MSLPANKDPIVSGGPAVPPGDAEQRAATRYTPLIRTGKITSPAGEFLCVVSDVSETGVSVRVFHPLPEHDDLTLEMPNGDQLAILPVWQKEGRAGFRFAEPVDLSRILEGRSKWPRRPIRLNLELPATLSGLTGRFDATIRNISLQGAQIECASRLALDQRLRLSSPVFADIVTKVRWRSDSFYGLIFDDTFHFADLARIAAYAQGINFDRYPA